MKDTARKIKRQATNWEKKCAKHVSDKNFVSGIRKGLSKLNNEKTTH